MTRSRLAIVALIPLLGGFKCIRYEAAPDAQGSSDDTDSGPFSPAVACDQVSVAQLSIDNYAYNIVCGCAEPNGKRCTVPVGTTVVWTFADSEQHNVTSVANTFGMSPSLLAGQFSKVFDKSGTYGYGCTIHSLDMAGYSIVAK